MMMPPSICKNGIMEGIKPFSSFQAMLTPLPIFQGKVTSSELTIETGQSQENSEADLFIQGAKRLSRHREYGEVGTFSITGNPLERGSGGETTISGTKGRCDLLRWRTTDLQ